MLYLRQDIVVEHLQHEGCDDAEDCGYQRHLHSRRHDCRADVTGILYLLERHHHAYHRAQESQRRCDGDKQGYPRAAFLKVCRLHRAVAAEAPLYAVCGAAYAQ